MPYIKHDLDVKVPHANHMLGVQKEQENKMMIIGQCTLYNLDLYHFDSVFLIAVTVFPTHFPHRNSEKHHYETNLFHNDVFLNFGQDTTDPLE